MGNPWVSLNNPWVNNESQWFPWISTDAPEAIFWQKQIGDFVFFFVFVGLIIGFLSFIIGLKWFINTWGWFPILFFDIFGNVQMSTKCWTLDPLFIAEIFKKTQDRIPHIFNT